ncbi:MAG: hypothetical protein HYV93_15590, partial [Candidatus Rokubacteria bacterium]|nr:hypothetical protein [Candidatus Rokubacteria bacterium]
MTIFGCASGSMSRGGDRSDPDTPPGRASRPHWLVRLGIQPDQISIASIAFAVLAALALILAGRVEAGARAALLVGAA